MKRKGRELAGFILALVIYIFIMEITGIGCPIRYVTGIPCLGCGMTRACASMVQGHIGEAVQYHPLCLCLPEFALLAVLSPYLSANVRKISWGVVIFLFAAVYIIRLSEPADWIVQIEIERGKIYRIIRRIYERRI